MSDRPLLGFGPFTLDRIRRIVLRSGEPLPLTPKAFDILSVLVENGGRVVSKETLLERAWPDVVVEESNLTFQMSALRKALGEREVIATIPGRGYQLAVPVREVETSEIVLEERATTTLVLEESASDRSRLWWVLALAIAVVLLGAWWAARQRQPTPGPARISSIAVLPFKPIAADQNDEALELAMADAIISRISAMRDVTVRPLTAVRDYAAVNQDPIAAGRRLRVDAVLDGSILHSANRIRVNARLLRVSDGRQIWSGHFDNEYKDIFSVQDSISARLVNAVSVNLSPGEQRRMQKRDTSNVEAYRAYTVGRMHMFAIRGDRYDAAIENFDRAIALDPKYAAAWASLGQCFAQMHISSDRPPSPNFEKAKDAARRAIELDPEVAESYAVLGTVAFFHDWDWDVAEQNFRRAVALSPSDGWQHMWVAHLYSNTGRHDEAEPEALEAIRLEPHSAMINTLVGQFYLQAERYELALRQLQHTLSIAPDFWVAHLTIGKVYERLHRYDEALQHYQLALKGSGTNVEPLSMIGHLYGVQGKEKEARKVIEQLLAIRRERYFSAAKMALPYAAIGDKDEAFRWLRMACAERDVSMIFLLVNPRWQPITSDPRFREIERCVKLPQSVVR